MKIKPFAALLLCAVLFLCTDCGKTAYEQVTTTYQNLSIPDDVPTRSGEIPTREVPYPTVKIPTDPDDPYAQVIKDMYEQYAQHVTAEEIFKDFKYALYDIDRDGTQELLLSSWYAMWGIEEPEFDDGNDLTGKDGILFDRFYTIQNGKAIWVQPINGLWDGVAGATGGRDILTNSVIRLYGGRPDHISYAYYRYTEGRLEFLYALRYYADDESRYIVTYEGDQGTRTPITEEEFSRLRAEIEGNAQVVQIDWKPLESYGRE